MAIPDGGLEALCSALPPDEADDLRQERSAILEYCAGFTRKEAERRAGLGNVIGVENFATGTEGKND